MKGKKSSLKSMLSRAIGGLFIIVFLFLGVVLFVKDSMLTTWLSPSQPAMYEIIGDDERSLALITLKNNFVYLIYKDHKQPYAEMALTRMKGTKAVHLAGRLWRLSGPGQPSLFDWRIYGEGVEPWTMNIEYLDKEVIGRSDPTFPEVGASTISVILFHPDRLQFEGMWLKSRPVDGNLLETLQSMLPKE